MVAERGKPVIDVLAPGEDLAARLKGMGVPIDRPVVVLFGGADGLEEEAGERLYATVRDGIVAVAARLGAVIVDGGTQSGVMALAGRAKAELAIDVTLVGVSPSGKVTAPGVPSATGATHLEPNHSHQLLVPGENWGDESPPLLNAADAIAHGRPVVAVIVEGGAIALAESLEAANRGWPLVTLDGSGRSADLVAAYVRGDETPKIAVDKSSIHVVDLSAGPEPLAATLASLLGDSEPVSQPPSGDVGDAEVGHIEYPALYLAASEASRRGQSGLKWLAATEIGLTILGVTVANLLNLRGLASPVAIAFSAFPLLLAPLVKFVSFQSGFARDWFNGRAVAETVKGMAWRYTMRAAPYDGANADEQLARDLTTILRSQTDVRQALNRLPERPAQITPQMRSIRTLDLSRRADIYVNHRLLDQTAWYRRKSVDSRRRATIWFWFSLGFQLAAAGSAILAVAFDGGPMLALVATLGAASLAGTAWTQLSRYDEMARSYAVALQEVLLVADLARDFGTEAELSAYVASGEDAISREHRLWMAQRAASDDFETRTQ